MSGLYLFVCCCFTNLSVYEKQDGDVLLFRGLPSVMALIYTVRGSVYQPW